MRAKNTNFIYLCVTIVMLLLLLSGCGNNKEVVKVNNARIYFEEFLPRTDDIKLLDSSVKKAERKYAEKRIETIGRIRLVRDTGDKIALRLFGELYNLPSNKSINRTMTILISKNEYKKFSVKAGDVVRFKGDFHETYTSHERTMDHYTVVLDNAEIVECIERSQTLRMSDKEFWKDCFNYNGTDFGKFKSHFYGNADRYNGKTIILDGTVNELVRASDYGGPSSKLEIFMHTLRGDNWEVGICFVTDNATEFYGIGVGDKITISGRFNRLVISDNANISLGYRKGYLVYLEDAKLLKR